MKKMLLIDEKHNSLNVYEFDISSYNSGVYVYGITSDGILVKTGKFYIIR